MTESYLYEASQDDDDYVSIGWGKYKEKGKEDDKDAPTFKKTDAGKYIKGKDDEKGEFSPDKEEKPEKEPAGKLGGGDFERETEPERGEKPKAKRSDRYKDVDTSWQDDPEAAAAQGQQGRWPGQDEPTEPKGGAAKEITKDMK